MNDPLSDLKKIADKILPPFPFASKPNIGLVPTRDIMITWVRAIEKAMNTWGDQEKDKEGKYLFRYELKNGAIQYRAGSAYNKDENGVSPDTWRLYAKAAFGTFSEKMKASLAGSHTIDPRTLESKTSRARPAKYMYILTMESCPTWNLETVNAGLLEVNQMYVYLSADHYGGQPYLNLYQSSPITKELKAIEDKHASMPDYSSAEYKHNLATYGQEYAMIEAENEARKLGKEKSRARLEELEKPENTKMLQQMYQTVDYDELAMQINTLMVQFFNRLDENYERHEGKKAMELWSSTITGNQVFQPINMSYLVDDRMKQYLQMAEVKYNIMDEGEKRKYMEKYNDVVTVMKEPSILDIDYTTARKARLQLKMPTSVLPSDIGKFESGNVENTMRTLAGNRDTLWHEVRKMKKDRQGNPIDDYTREMKYVDGLKVRRYRVISFDFNEPEQMENFTEMSRNMKKMHSEQKIADYEEFDIHSPQSLAEIRSGDPPVIREKVIAYKDWLKVS